MPETSPPPETSAALRIAVRGSVATLTLNRPEQRNAFDDQLVADLTRAAAWLAANESIRVVVLQGAGTVFCAGADFNWMRRMAGYSFDENLEDARRLAAMLEALDTLPQATLCRVQGAALGGGMGLVAACDVALAEEGARFGFPEVKIGLTPATIAPYVVRRLGAGRCRELFLTGRRFSAQEALAWGLVAEVVPAERLDAALAARAADLLGSGPRAVLAGKELIRKVEHAAPQDIAPYTAELIAALRGGAEGQEGLRAALAKQRPSWTEEPCSDAS